MDKWIVVGGTVYNLGNVVSITTKDSFQPGEKEVTYLVFKTVGGGSEIVTHGTKGYIDNLISQIKSDLGVRTILTY